MARLVMMLKQAELVSGMVADALRAFGDSGIFPVEIK
jgi:hypothetical protein